jgi:outer membrane lipoprotein-sorting protein
MRRVCSGAAVLIALTTAAPLAAPLTWSDVVAGYGAVRDYTATYEKRERAIDEGVPQTIRLSFRKPFDVRLEWVDAQGRVEQTAVYRQGLNDGKLIARRSGMLGSLVGAVRLDPKGKLALEDSTHPITEVGIGHIIEAVAQDLHDGRAIAQAATEDLVEGHSAWRFELEAAGSVPLVGLDAARRAIIWIDASVKLPIKVEILDAAGVLIERHQFRNLRLNVGLSDHEFTP